MLLIGLAGLGAGAINALVGSGTLITFPTLVALGYPPVTSTMSNAVGLVAGGISGTWGYRAELRGQWDRLRWQIPASTSMTTNRPDCPRRLRAAYALTNPALPAPNMATLMPGLTICRVRAGAPAMSINPKATGSEKSAGIRLKIVV